MTSDERRRAPISVVVTTYNDADFLGQALAGVAQQTVRPAQVVVVDDGSTERAARGVVEQFNASSDLEAGYIWQANRGPAAARNVGLARTDQPFVAYLDADDVWLPVHLETKLELLEARDDSYSHAYGGWQAFGGTGRRRVRAFATYDGPIPIRILGKDGGIPVAAQFLLFRRSALEAMGGFDESLTVGEDHELVLRLARDGYRLTGSGQPTVRFRQHPGSHTRRNPRRQLDETLRFIEHVEREGLLPADMLATMRKRAYITTARRATPDNGLDAVSLLREAFAVDRPRGLPQWLAYLAVRSRRMGRLLVGRGRG
jgi:glycosyltransferase involved in cell wall biosynthesis